MKRFAAFDSNINKMIISLDKNNSNTRNWISNASMQMLLALKIKRELIIYTIEENPNMCITKPKVNEAFYGYFFKNEIDKYSSYLCHYREKKSWNMISYKIYSKLWMKCYDYESVWVCMINCTK